MTTTDNRYRQQISILIKEVSESRSSGFKRLILRKICPSVKDLMTYMLNLMISTSYQITLHVSEACYLYVRGINLILPVITLEVLFLINYSYLFFLCTLNIKSVSQCKR